MQIYNDLDIEPPKYERGLALGFFDGVHVGHQKLISTLIRCCAEKDRVPAVFTFSDHPASHFHPDKDHRGLIVQTEERARLIAELGVEELFIMPLEPDLYRLEAEDFLETWLDQRLNCRLIVAGEDFRFGHKAKGDVELLRHWTKYKRIDLRIVPDFEDQGEKVSSTRIRELIARGNLSEARRLMGTPFTIVGSVSQGKRLGRRLGFPTANLAWPERLVVPPYGVYSSHVIVDGRSYDAVTNVGTNPTVSDDTSTIKVESWLFDFNQDLYGCQVRLELMTFLRPERAFAHRDDLRRQVEQDKLDAQRDHRRRRVAAPVSIRTD